MEFVEGVAQRHPKATPHLRTRLILTQYDQSCGNCSDSSAKVSRALHGLLVEVMGSGVGLGIFLLCGAETSLSVVEEYEIFEKTMKKVTLETEEGDMLCAVVSEVGEELDSGQKDQDRLQDELEFICEGMVTASREFTNCWTAICADVEKASQRTADLKR